MALSDDLKSFEELHSRGRLTDQEFTAAKATAIANAGAVPQNPAVAQPAPKAAKKSPWRPFLLVLIGVVLIWVYIQSRLTQPAANLLKEVVHMPMDLSTETFTI